MSRPEGAAARPTRAAGPARRLLPVLCAGLLAPSAWAAPALADDPAVAPAGFEQAPVERAPVEQDDVAEADQDRVEVEQQDEAPDTASPVLPEPDEGVLRPDLSVTLGGPPTGWAGGEGAYTVTVANAAAATAAASGFSVSWTAPAGQTVLSVSSPAAADWSCVLSDQVSCTWYGALTPGARTAPVTVVLGHGRRATGTLTSAVRVSAATDEVHLADNARTVSTVMQVPELAVAVDAPTSVAPGGPLRVVLAVTNRGPGWASGFSLVGGLPAGLRVASVSGTGFDCAADLRSCTYTDLLPPGLSAAVAVDGTVAEGWAGGPLRTTARLGSGGPSASALTEVTLPEVTLPEVDLPEVDLPEVSLPVPSTTGAGPVAPVTAPVLRVVQAPVRTAGARPAAVPVARAATGGPRPSSTVAAARQPRSSRVVLPAARTRSGELGRAGAAAPSVLPSALPFTGPRVDDGLTAAAGLLLSGLVLAVLGRRRRAHG